MNKQEILSHLMDIETNLSSALNSDEPRSFILGAKDSLAAATQGVSDLVGPHSNGLDDLPVDPEAPSAQPGLTETGHTDTSTEGGLTAPPTPPADVDGDHEGDVID